MSRIRAATLAVGTELTDGQIIDRNSAWISQKLVAAGIEVVEHRAVADDRGDIERALGELSSRVELLFVTGGLGPTSDDFTRELFATVFGLPLEYDEASWLRIVERFEARGMVARPIQKQQCYYPKTARILENPAGTANAFSFTVTLPGSFTGAGPNPSTTCLDRRVVVYALPGPPLEIAAVWEKHLGAEIEALVPVEEREELVIFRTLGRGESEIAELTEDAIRGSGLRVGYRAHLPYVEVKLWYKRKEGATAAATLASVEKVLGPWVVNKNSDDLAGDVIDFAINNKSVYVRDEVTGGYLHERLIEKMRERKFLDRSLARKGALEIETILPLAQAPTGELLGVPSDSGERLRSRAANPGDGIGVMLIQDSRAGLWRLIVKNDSGSETELEVKPTPIYNIDSERGRRYAAEKALHLLVTQFL